MDELLIEIKKLEDEIRQTHTDIRHAEEMNNIATTLDWSDYWCYRRLTELARHSALMGELGVLLKKDVDGGRYKKT